MILLVLFTCDYWDYCEERRAVNGELRAQSLG